MPRRRAPLRPLPSPATFDCTAIGFAVAVTGPDDDDLDREGAGVGCESDG